MKPDYHQFIKCQLLVAFHVASNVAFSILEESLLGFIL